MGQTPLWKAINFFNSHRGQYLVSQALRLAIDKLNEVQPETRIEQEETMEAISDMEYLFETMFHSYADSEKRKYYADPRKYLADRAKELADCRAKELES